MPFLLHIDTSTATGSVCLSKSGHLIIQKISAVQKDHASVIVPFIDEIFNETGIKRSVLDGISISAGPGSYTGLRVATSTAKGLCYTLGIPLIAISTLKMMVSGLRNNYTVQEDALLCPMIDARRQEVFMALYDAGLNVVREPEAAILTENLFQNYSDKHTITIFGTGAEKAKKLLKEGAGFSYQPYQYRASDLIAPAEEAFRNKQFQDLAYFDPVYLKSVYLPKSNKP